MGEHWTILVSADGRAVIGGAADGRETFVAQEVIAHKRVEVVPFSQLEQSARDTVSLALTAGMPDSYWATDTRLIRAREVLGDEEFEKLRYT